MAIAESPLPAGGSPAGVPQIRVDPAHYRQAMRLVPGAVTVVTAGDGATRRGMTATAVSSLSAEPPQILVCINRNSPLVALIRATGRLAVNFLAEDQAAVAAAFAAPAEDPETRFRAGEWRASPQGQPVLSGALTTLDCALVEALPRASHVLLIGLVLAAGPGARMPAERPLLYHAGAYSGLAPLAGAAA